jgi:hypothetical protein
MVFFFSILLYLLSFSESIWWFILEFMIGTAPWSLKYISKSIINRHTVS